MYDRKKVVCMVSVYCCIRVLKQAAVLKKFGYTVGLVAGTIRSKGLFDFTIEFDDANKLYHAIDGLKDYVDIWHVHNEPSWPIIVIRESVPDAKIVFDCHDSRYWYFDRDKVRSDMNEEPYWYGEDVAFQCCDAVVAPSAPAADEITSRGLNKPVIWVPAAVPLAEYRYVEAPLYGGLVSQGGHSAPTGEYDHWRDYTQLYTALKGKVRVFAYSPNFTNNPEDPLDKHYISTGAILGKFSYEQLMDRLPSHTWNLVGNTLDHNVWKYSLPNKLFEGLACGVPSVVFKSEQPIKIVQEYDIGIVCETADELVERWGEHMEKRKNVWLRRRELCLEKFYDPMEAMYAQL